MGGDWNHEDREDQSEHTRGSTRPRPHDAQPLHPAWWTGWGGGLRAGGSPGGGIPGVSAVSSSVRSEMREGTKGVVRLVRGFCCAEDSDAEPVNERALR